METPLLVGVHGVAYSGKDTCFSYVEKWAQENGFTTRRRGFADKLKWSLARLFFPDISMEDAIEWANTFKQDRANTNFMDVYCEEAKAAYQHARITGRVSLRHKGTEGGRDIFGSDFWVDQLLPLDEIGYPLDSHNRGPLWYKQFELDQLIDSAQPADICGITDFRFTNEGRRIKELGGQAWKIKNETALQKIIAQARERGEEIHASELEIPDEQFDAVLDNNDWGNPDHLGEQVFNYLDDLANVKLGK